MKKIITLLTLTLIFVSCENGIEHIGELPKVGGDTIFFLDVYENVFQANCVGCHGNGFAQANFNMEGWDEGYTNMVNVPSSQVPSLLLIEPGNPENSYLFQKITGANGVSLMPPNNKLEQDKIDLVETWINQGALKD